MFAARYRIVQILGVGGLGDVYEVEPTAHGRRLVMKVFSRMFAESPEATARFQQALGTTSAFDLRHLLDVLDAGVDARTGLPFAVAELLVGERLDERQARAPRSSQDDALAVLAAVASALDELHRNGVVHRGLRPEAVFVTPADGGAVRAKLLWTGVEKLVAELQRGLMFLSSRARWYAPEQTYSEDRAVPATDAWALGLLAYQMLVGVPYWREGTEPADVYRQVLMSPLPSPVARAAETGVELPAAFDAWFFDLVARDPSARRPVAGEAVATLRSVLGDAAPLWSSAKNGSS